MFLLTSDYLKSDFIKVLYKFSAGFPYLAPPTRNNIFLNSIHSTRQNFQKPRSF